ncbi:MAG: hypothetical protein IIC24_12800 [Chloroflexi bacterium]|nr:hypothetical protein [Chloroflexota bacterium]
MIREGIVNSAHDCSDGGLLVTIAESCIVGGVGMTIHADIPNRWDAALFGEEQSRIVVSLQGDQVVRLSDICAEEDVFWCEIGKLGGDSLKVGDMLDVPLTDVEEAWKHGLESALKPGS